MSDETIRIERLESEVEALIQIVESLRNALIAANNRITRLEGKPVIVGKGNLGASP